MKAAIVAVLLCASGLLQAETGIASWYGPGFRGKTTANGETFDTGELTAAHKTLPFGTLVSVTNLSNGRSVVVRINDRGPFVTGRIIDLSEAAARRIDMISSGTAPVRVEPESEAAPKAPDGLAIQVGAYGVAGNAVRVQRRLEEEGFEVVLQREGEITRVRVVGVTEGALSQKLGTLSSLGFDSCMILRP